MSSSKLLSNDIQKAPTKLGIGAADGKAKVQNTGELIGSLKKVFSNTELKVITQCL